MSNNNNSPVFHGRHPYRENIRERSFNKHNLVMRVPYRSNSQISSINFENTKQSDQAQSFSTLQAQIFDPLINNGEAEKYQQLMNSSDVNDTLISNSQSIYDTILPNHFMSQYLDFSLGHDPELILLDSNESSKGNIDNIHLNQFTNTEYLTRFEHHIMYPLLLKLMDQRGSLFFNTDLNELLSRTEELSAELSKASGINMNTDLDKDIWSYISTVVYQIVEICNKEIEIGDEFLKIRNEFERTIIVRKHHEEQLNNNNLVENWLTTKTNINVEEKKATRQNMDPMAVLWFIKYLMDHKLEKPNKKHRYLLSLWTSVPEHDIDRWFIRTMGNYVKKLNDVEKVREKLNERAINTTRQLRKPNSLRTSSSESRKADSQRNLPYQRPTRGRKEKKS